MSMSEESKPTRTGGKALAFLVGIMFLNGLGFTIISPVTPFIVQQYLNSPDDLGAVVGWITAIYAVCQFVAAPGLGLLSDRFGRRPILLFCLAGSAVGFIMFGIGGSLAMLLASRVVDGLTGGNISVAFAYVADTTEPEERGKIFGRIGGAMGVSFIIGPVVGGLASKISLETPLYLAAGLTIIGLVWGYFFLPESLHHTNRRETVKLRDLNPFGQLGSVIGMKSLRGLLLVGMLYAFPFAVLIANFSVLIIDSLHWDPTTIGFVSLAIGVTDIVVQGWLVGKLLPIFGATKLLVVGMIFQVLAYGLLGSVAIVPSPISLILGIFFYAFGSGFIEPTLAGLVSQSVGPEQQGLVNGANQALQSLTRVAGPIWVGLIYGSLGHAVPYWFNIVFIAVGIVVILKTIVHIAPASPAPVNRPLEEVNL